MRFLLDKSAFTRTATSPLVQDALRVPMLDGSIAVCGVLLLEAGWSARSGEDHRRLVAHLAQLPQETVVPADWDRAFEVQGALVARGQHRSAGLADLLTAACAERSGRTVLHYDSDFDVVAAVTGQPTRWVVPRGTADR